MRRCEDCKFGRIMGDYGFGNSEGYPIFAPKEVYCKLKKVDFPLNKRTRCKYYTRKWWKFWREK